MFRMLIANILGVILLFFLLWKRLKDDYHYEKIFNLGSIVLIGVVVVDVATRYFLQNYWFWIQVVVILALFLWVLSKQKLKFFESLDALIIGLLPWLGLGYLVDSIKNSSLSSFLSFWIILLFIFAYFFLDSQYRRFTWYRSGRVGFAGVVVACLLFISRIILYLIYPQTTSYVSIYDPYLSATFAIVFLFLTYKLTFSKE